MSFHETIERLLLPHIKLLLVVQHLQRECQKVDRSEDSSLAHLVEEVGLLEPLPLEEGNEVLLELGNELVRLGLLLGDQLHPVHLVQTPELTKQLLHLNEIDKLKNS